MLQNNLKETWKINLLRWKTYFVIYYDVVFQITYTEVGVLNGDTNTMMTEKENHILESLLPGRNYSISVQAVSNQVQSDPVITYQATSK